jgi:predicted small lipoprotein YifL
MYVLNMKYKNSKKRKLCENNNSVVVQPPKKKRKSRLNRKYPLDSNYAKMKEKATELKRYFYGPPIQLQCTGYSLPYNNKGPSESSSTWDQWSAVEYQSVKHYLQTHHFLCLTMYSMMTRCFNTTNGKVALFFATLFNSEEIYPVVIGHYCLWMRCMVHLYTGCTRGPNMLKKNLQQDLSPFVMNLHYRDMALLSSLTGAIKLKQARIQKEGHFIISLRFFRYVHTALYDIITHCSTIQQPSSLLAACGQYPPLPLPPSTVMIYDNNNGTVAYNENDDQHRMDKHDDVKYLISSFCKQPATHRSDALCQSTALCLEDLKEYKNLEISSSKILKAKQSKFNYTLDNPCPTQTRHTPYFGVQWSTEQLQLIYRPMAFLFSSSNIQQSLPSCCHFETMYKPAKTVPTRSKEYICETHKYTNDEYKRPRAGPNAAQARREKQCRETFNHMIPPTQGRPSGPYQNLRVKTRKMYMNLSRQGKSTKEIASTLMMLLNIDCIVLFPLLCVLFIVSNILPYMFSSSPSFASNSFVISDRSDSVHIFAISMIWDF